MKIITIAAEKGGVGKSTLTATLAVIAALEGRGERVGLLDADPQGSLTAWWNTRSAEWPLIFGLVGTIGQTVASIEAEGLDFLFIDTPPGYSAIRAQAIECADFVLIPTGAGAFDVGGIQSTSEIAKRACVPFRVVLNRAAFRTRLTGDAVIALRQLRDFIEPVVHARQPIMRAIESGRTVAETEPDTPGAAEMRGLWGEIAVVLAALPARKWPRLARMRRAS